MENTIMAAIAIIVSVIALWASIASLRYQKRQLMSGPELFIYFEKDELPPTDILVLENIGNESLDLDISVFVDPNDDDRYEVEGKFVWRFRRRLHAGRSQRWRHSFQAMLQAMGYRDDCTYIVRFVGNFWPSARGHELARHYSQTYKVIQLPGGALYVEQSDDDWYYADDAEKGYLKRERIPEALRKENRGEKPLDA